jgi:hypothetical protein
MVPQLDLSEFGAGEAATVVNQQIRSASTAEERKC